eukprot:jgi/Botrbrau1/13817/Bobra.0056s0059.1
MSVLVDCMLAGGVCLSTILTCTLASANSYM